MNYQDYLKDDSDGDVAFLNRKGHQIAKNFIARNGGVSGVYRLTNISRPTLTRIQKEAKCSPETWKKLYTIIIEAA